MSTTRLYGFALAGILLSSCAGPPVRHNPAVSARDQERRDMILHQVEGRGIHDRQVLYSLNDLPREAFVAPSHQAVAYQDQSLPMAAGHTRELEPAYVTAAILQALKLKGVEKVLELGSGNGYRACLLSRLSGEVYALESDTQLGLLGEQNTRDYSVHSVHFRIGPLAGGWPDRAPFDRILVSVAPQGGVDFLTDQLADGGIMILGPAAGAQTFTQWTRVSAGYVQREEIPLASP